MKYRIEHDSLGEVKVESNKYWGAQTQRSLKNFNIGIEKMPKELIYSFALLKKACAISNNKINNQKITSEKCNIICKVCDEIISSKLDNHFPLSVWQTGSGTQTNMNINEVITNRGNEIANKSLLHPNDDVNLSQSSNDTFPSVMHISVVLETKTKLLLAVNDLINSFIKLEKENEGIIKSGRTHLQDATPISFSQEISGWRYSLEKDYELINTSVEKLTDLAIGGTAVGTGLNADKKFPFYVCEELTKMTNVNFKPSENKFHSLTSKDELVFYHGALKALACDLMKIANDIRLLSSGPRLGLGEITIPENEPGSSIMPGKINPTQCEAVTMVSVQVIANDTAVGLSASLGNFELNVFMPVCIYNILNSIKLLTDVINSFNKNCVIGIKANKEKMHNNLYNSLMLATCLTPYIGYDNVSKAVLKAHKENISLKNAILSLNLLSDEEFDNYYKPENMI